MKPIYNSLTCPLKLTRREVCDIALALSVMNDEMESNRWKELHDKVCDQLHEFDKAHTSEYGLILTE